MTTLSMPTVGSFLFSYLYDQGAKHAFGIPGDFVLPTFRWLHQSPIELITMTHEPSVGFAADGYARIHGIGVACVTYCVGGLNMLNSIACAYAEKSPVIVIAGAPSMEDRAHNPLLHHKVKTFDTQKNIYQEVTCDHTVLTDPNTAANEIIRVVTQAKRHCLPVYIEVPYDVVDKPISLPTLVEPPQPQSDAEILSAALEDAKSMLEHARQPVIIADIELHRFGLTDHAVYLAKTCNIPIAATLLSKSVISETNPLYIGVYSGGLSDPLCQKYVEESDCILMLGAFITDIFLGEYTADLQRKHTILVTSDKIRVSLRSYDHIFFKDFLQGLCQAGLTAKPSFVHPNPLQPLPALSAQEKKEALSATTLFRILDQYISKANTVVCDTGDALIGAMGIHTMKRQSFISDAYYLSMGFAIPASIGAMAGRSEEKVCVLVGDGAFQMTGMELSTAAKYGFKPLVIIINNDGYGTQRHIIDGPFNDIHPWNYTRICDVLRYGRSWRVDTNQSFETALKEAISLDEMCIIEAIIPRHDCSAPLKRMAQALGKLRNRTSSS